MNMGTTGTKILMQKITDNRKLKKVKAMFSTKRITGLEKF